MRGTDSLGDLERTDAAFNRVLEAEARARALLEDCRRQAAERVAAAAERVRALEHRTESRLLLVHRCADAKVAEALRALEGRGDDGDSETSQVASPELEPAVETLADEIIGAKPAAGEPGAGPEGPPS